MASEALAKELFRELADLSSDPPGITRAAFGPEETAAHALIRKRARDLGLETREDAFGNSLAILEGGDPRSLVIGSHLDSVRHGGNFDGAAGVVIGLLVAETFTAMGRTPPLNLSVAALRAEESVWFPSSYLGSKAALGLLPAETLDNLKRSDSGRTLRAHLEEAGLRPDDVARGEPLLEPTRIAAFIEPHIEQGPVMIGSDWPLAAVTSIAGSVRYRTARCLGCQGHSGAVPHGFRSDAALGAAALVVALDRLRSTLERAGHELTITVGELFTDPAVHAFSKIAGLCRLSIDARSPSEATLALAAQEIIALAHRMEAEHCVRFDLGPLTSSRPVRLDPGLELGLRQALRIQGLPERSIASGAGHDAAQFQAAGVPSAMLFIRNENGSHNPEESMSIDDACLAADVLTRFVEEFQPDAGSTAMVSQAR